MIFRCATVYYETLWFYKTSTQNNKLVKLLKVQIYILYKCRTTLKKSLKISMLKSSIYLFYILKVNIYNHKHISLKLKLS